MTNRSSALRVSLSFVAGLALAGCVSTYYTRPGALRPSTATVAPAERIAAWQHAIGALLDQGYVPQVVDATAGYIQARRREDLANDALTGTMATVVISPEGNVRVEVTGIGQYSSEDAFLKAVGERQDVILRAIMAAHASATRPSST